MMERTLSGEPEYHSKDFEWEQLREEIENDPSLQLHLIPFDNSQSGTFPLPQEDSDAWNKFHTRHLTGKFFKERRYLLKEFPELASCGEYSKVLEVGCGNGSTALPILRQTESAIVYACDCSTEALQRAKEIVNASSVISAKHRFSQFQCDFAINKFPRWLACDSCRENSLHKRLAVFSNVHNGTKDTNDLTSFEESECCIGGVDFVTLIFTLSAVPPHRMTGSVAECFSVLKPGGLLFFRDYGLYDMTMLRFKPEQRVGFREYMRLDGTRSYFFCLDNIKDLFSAVGFIKIELEYCCVKSVNRQNGKSMRRVWVHGKFQKPM